MFLARAWTQLLRATSCLSSTEAKESLTGILGFKLCALCALCAACLLTLPPEEVGIYIMRSLTGQATCPSSRYGIRCVEIQSTDEDSNDDTCHVEATFRHAAHGRQWRCVTGDVSAFSRRYFQT